MACSRSRDSHVPSGLKKNITSLSPQPYLFFREYFKFDRWVTCSGGEFFAGD